MKHEKNYWQHTIQDIIIYCVNFAVNYKNYV